MQGIMFLFFIGQQWKIFRGNVRRTLPLKIFHCCLRLRNGGVASSDKSQTSSARNEQTLLRTLAGLSSGELLHCAASHE